MTDENSIETFAEQIRSIKETASRNDKKAVIREIADEEMWEEKIAILSGQEFDDLGISTKSATDVVAQAYGKMDTTVEDDVSEAGSVTEAAMDYGRAGGYVDDLDMLYDDLQSMYDMRGDKQKSELARMIQTFSVPWVVVWAAVGRMKIGVSHNTITKAVTENKSAYSKDDVKDMRAIIPDSVEFVRKAKDGEVVTEPMVGTPFKAMKAKSDGMPDDPSDWLAQPKIDGYRVIIHISDGDISAFTTGLEDRSDILPELNEIDWPDGEWIFDSEVVASDNSYTKTSERMQRNAGSTLPHEMNFWVFDCLYVDGEDVSQEPFDTRIDYVFENLPEHGYLVPVHAFDDVEFALDQAREMGYEGLVVKQKEHGFRFGERPSAWQKVKITEETADLRVRDFKAGTGENAGTLGALYLETEDGVEMGSVGTGFSDKVRDEIWNNQGDWEGAIVEVTFDADEGYDSGLRFPRFERRRDDKLQANDLDYLKELADT